MLLWLVRREALVSPDPIDLAGAAAKQAAINETKRNRELGENGREYLDESARFHRVFHEYEDAAFEGKYPVDKTDTEAITTEACRMILEDLKSVIYGAAENTPESTPDTPQLSPDPR